jgi:hypothetical protein
MDLLCSLRGLLFVEALAATSLYAWIFGTKVATPGHGWSYRLTAFGIFGTLIYVSAIQVKAHNRHSPFDGYSWLGLVFVTLLLTGLILYVSKRADSTDGT